MAKYRQKPIEIEAFQMGIDERPDWFQDKVTANAIYTKELKIAHLPRKFRDKKLKYPPTYCYIRTSSGRIKADFGDYIIREPHGGISVCLPEHFETNYDLLTHD